MRSGIVAAALVGAAAASWAPEGGPPAYGSGSWGESSAAPVTSAAPPAYSSPASVAPVSSAAPASSAAPVYTTEVVTAYTTFCPEATEITHGGITYTATEATTLTITDCPGGCTVTKPISSALASPVYSTPASSPVAPVPYPSGNATVPTWSTAAPSESFSRTTIEQ